MISLYRFLTTIFYPLFIIFIYFRKILKKEDSVRYKEKFLSSHFRSIRNKNKKLIWFHAASIGELKSILPIINKLNDQNENFEFLITTITLSSSNLAKEELKLVKNSYHRFLPIDVNFLIKKFFKVWSPDIIFLVDSEIWPNLILNSQQLKIPIGLINARLTSNSLKKWMMFPKIAKRIFKVFDLFICSDSKTKNFLEKLNLKNVYFKGNIKLFGQVDAKKIKDINENYLIEKKFWFAASTHKDEDIFCINTHLKLKKKFPNISTIIAPRHVERSQKIKSLCEKFNLNAQVLNKNEVILNNKEIIIVNYFGFLHNYFKYSKSVFIGKSMVEKLKNEGGQNPIEAAKLSCKIYHGPYVSNFEEIYKILEESNISKKIYSFDELSSNLAIDLENSQKKSSEISNTISGLGEKTLNDTMQLINNFLDDVN
jgi:3-deoxy-D-manno-octulosonic-acid transferase